MRIDHGFGPMTRTVVQSPGSFPQSYRDVVSKAPLRGLQDPKDEFRGVLSEGKLGPEKGRRPSIPFTFMLF